MSETLFVQCRVSREMKLLIRNMAVQEALTESALIRNLLETLFRTGAPPEEIQAQSATAPNRSQRLFLRVAGDDRALLEARAKDRGLAPATYAAVLLRAHLRALTPLPKAELLALKSLTAELAAIGRNLNQLTRAIHGNANPHGPGPQQVATLLKLSSGLRDHVKALLLANERSWQSGHVEEKR